MDLNLTEEQSLIVAMVRRFVREEILPLELDLDPDADELDPALIEDVRRNVHNPRVGSGLGVIPRVVAGGRSIYRGNCR